MVTTSKSMHRQVQIKHDLMTHKWKYNVSIMSVSHYMTDRQERFDLKKKKN